MAELLTPWGYGVGLAGDVATMPPLLSAAEFRRLSRAQLSSTDEAIEAKLRAVSSAVRDWCRWHVSPSLPCSCDLDGGTGTLWLPCMGVTSVQHVTLGGAEAYGYEWAARGELRLARRAPDRLRYVHVEFTAGYDAAATEAIAQVVCQLAENALIATPGLREEHAGQVGATYNMTANGVSGGVRLLDSDREALAPYRAVLA